MFETGSRHYDRHNRLHKERPVRITSIMEALQKADHSIYDRCCVLGEKNNDDATNTTNESNRIDDGGGVGIGTIMPTTSATKFLDDHDFLRVHLPGYMKR